MAERTCAACGNSLEGRRSNVKYCDIQCGEVGRGRRKPRLPPRTCLLVDCDVVFVPSGDRQRCCCEAHGALNWTRRNLAAGRVVRPPWNDKRKDAFHRRRAMLKGARTGKRVSFSKIAERDGWICGICHQPVYATLVWPHPLCPSQDHVIPLSRGGAHDPDNIQLAHYRCNVSKGSKVAA